MVKNVRLPPLLFSIKQASIEQDQDDFYFSILNESHDINESLLQLLIPEENNQKVPDTQCSKHSPSKWVSYLKQSKMNLNLLELLKFPTLVGTKEINKALNSDELHLIPASMLVLVDRATSSRGILHEIDSILANDQLSSSLNNLLAEPNTGVNRRVSLKYDYLPGLLSNAQKKVVSIAANASLGCTSGPPGTGKSYSIAAIAAEHIQRNESVLIVANNDSALNVIADKLTDNFALGDIAIRAGQKEFLKQLKSYVADLLAGYHQLENSVDPIVCETELKSLNRQLTKLENKFTVFCKKAIRRGQRLHKLEQKNIQWLTSLYLSIASGSMRKLGSQWETLTEINQNQEKREQLAASYLSAVKNANLNSLIQSHRPSLQAFNKAIRSRTSKRQFEMFSDIDYDVLLSAFPIWLASLNSLHRVLPLDREMFDLVIIDEASQCNITSCIPALFRAKRAMIVGDSKQLRHYSFLAKNKQQQILLDNHLENDESGVVSYRDSSVLDLTLEVIQSDQQLAFLDEHFRSKPELIDFSNQQFYQGKLRIMQHRPSTTSGFLHLTKLDGVRNKKGINEIEALAIIESIKLQITEDEALGLFHSIGVITPFRDQADYLAQLIAQHFTSDLITKYKLRSATPYGFQGEEHDIMLISFVIDNDSRGAIHYLNKADMFNVLITRARQKQIVYLSVDSNSLKSNNLLKLYLDSKNSFEATHQLATVTDAFQESIRKELINLDIQVWPGYQLAGVEVDLLCCKNNKYLAIDLIGFPGPWVDFYEINSYKLLKRAGIEILPVSYGLWRIDPKKCIEKIINVLDA